MPWSKTNTIPALSSKPDKVKEVFAEAANTALSKGQDEQAAVFAGLAAVKNYEKKHLVSKAIIRPHQVPLHLQAVIEVKKAKDFIAVTKQLELEKQAAIAGSVLEN